MKGIEPQIPQSPRGVRALRPKTAAYTADV